MSSPLAKTAWIVLALTMAACAAALDLEHNVILWHWRGLTPTTLSFLALYAIALVAMIRIAPRTRDRPATAIMWTFLMLLTAFGLLGLRPERVTDPPKPRTPSPLAYRGARAAALAAPLLAVYARRRRRPLPEA